jgi:hypothetical protein
VHVSEKSAYPSFEPTLQMFNMSPFGDSTDVDFRTRSTVPGDGPGLPVHFATHKQPVSSNFLYQSLTVLSVGGSVR